MYKKVLIPLDGSATAECALNHLRQLVGEGFTKEVVLLHIVKIDIPWAQLYDQQFNINAIRDEAFTVARRYLAEVEARLAAEGLQVKTEARESNRPAEAILEYAREQEIGLILLATHGHTGFRNLVLGSVAQGVLSGSPVPVLLIRPEACAYQA